MDSEPEEEEEGGAGWIMTFADLMSLLMCFFVLLLSFSEMDLQKYKQVAGSMKFAFGVQKKVKTDDIPKGTSLVADKFSPGKPREEVILQQMKQDTTDDLKDNLNFDRIEAQIEAENLAELLKEALEREIEAGILEIILDGDEVTVRIREKDSFPSASADLDPEFFPVLDKVTKVLDESKGQIMVNGHTDNLPISNERYGSNWVLSAARAARVVHYMVDDRLSDVSRIELRGHADTRPVTTNDTPENRAKNRRVEIVVSFENVIGDAIKLREMFGDQNPETYEQPVDEFNEFIPQEFAEQSESENSPSESTATEPESPAD